ncbi:MAG: hypothetical protein ACN2B6_00685, partial [Rickettsiales bacterium]
MSDFKPVPTILFKSSHDEIDPHFEIEPPVWFTDPIARAADGQHVMMERGTVRTLKHCVQWSPHNTEAGDTKLFNLLPYTKRSMPAPYGAPRTQGFTEYRLDYMLDPILEQLWRWEKRVINKHWNGRLCKVESAYQERIIELQGKLAVAQRPWYKKLW